MSIIDQILSLSRVRCYCVLKLSYQKSLFFNRQIMFQDRFVSFSHFRDVAVFAFQKKFCVAIEHIYADEIESFLFR